MLIYTGHAQGGRRVRNTGCHEKGQEVILLLYIIISLYYYDIIIVILLYYYIVMNLVDKRAKNPRIQRN